MSAWLGMNRETTKDLKESILALSFSTFGVLFTGVTIGYFTDSLKTFPALLILIPPAIGMRGNIFASLGSRLGTYLHTGEVVVGKRSRILNEYVMGSFTLTFSMSLYLGLLAWLIARRLGMEEYENISFLSIVLISYLAGFFSALIMILFTFSITFKSYSNGWNPDNITAPLITIAGDVITLPLLFLSFLIVVRLEVTTQMMIFLLFIICSVLSFLPLNKKKNFRRIVIESLPVFFVCGLLSSFSGSILGMNSANLFSFTAILMILPAFLEDGGAIGGILASRFSSALHTGEMLPGKIPPKALHLFLMMHLIGLIMFPLIGIFGYIVSVTFSISANLINLIIVALIAGELLIFVVNILSYYLSNVSFKMGINPDNVVIPILTSSMDFFGTACLVGIAFVLGFT